MTRASPTRSGDADATVLVSEDGVGGVGACTDLLARGDAALVISLDATPREWLADRDRSGLDPAFVATYPHPDCVRVVSDLRKPVDVALAAEAYLGSLPADHAPAVCVDDVAPLVARAGPLRAARFLHVLANRVRAAGGTIHHHGDPPLPDLSPTQL